MGVPTMIYRKSVDSDPSKTFENEFGKWEWNIIDFDGGELPSGWQATPFGTAANSDDDKPKKGRKAKPDTVEGDNGDSD